MADEITPEDRLWMAMEKSTGETLSRYCVGITLEKMREIAVPLGFEVRPCLSTGDPLVAQEGDEAHQPRRMNVTINDGTITRFLRWG